MTSCLPKGTGVAKGNREKGIEDSDIEHLLILEQ